MVWCWVRVGRKLPYLSSQAGGREKMAPASDTGLSMMKLEAGILPGSAIGWQRHWPFKRMKHGRLGSEEQKENAAEASEAPSVSGASGGLADWNRVPGWTTGCLRSLALPQWTCTKQKHITPTMDPLPKRYLPFSLLHHHMGQCREAGDGEEGEQRQEQTKERTLPWTWV